MKTGQGNADSSAVDVDAPTRRRVVASILEHGPSTPTQLAERLDVTPAAIRRHLAQLVDDGTLISRPEPTRGPRGRGRPASQYVLTDQGRSSFYHAYDDLASEAIALLIEAKGDEGVAQLAEQRFGQVMDRFEQIDPTKSSVEALAEALSENGFVASVRPAVAGDQLCQYHCPVAHVAEKYPELCEHETRIFSQLLDSHVQRLATIAHGDGVCTLHVPEPVRDPREGNDE